LNGLFEEPRRDQISIGGEVLVTEELPCIIARQLGARCRLIDAFCGKVAGVLTEGWGRTGVYLVLVFHCGQGVLPVREERPVGDVRHGPGCDVLSPCSCLLGEIPFPQTVFLMSWVSTPRRVRASSRSWYFHLKITSQGGDGGIHLCPDNDAPPGDYRNQEDQ
jgi:hypothetical protein